MAPALQCPRCAAKHPVDRHAGEASFPCSGCGQLLKVPEQFRGPPRSSTGSTGALPAARGASPEAAPRRPGAIWRLLAWVVAVLLGGLVVLVAARAVGYLDGQRALDVVIASGFRRYLVLLPLVPIWAVVTTILVTIFLDGASVLARRRATRPGADERPAVAASASPPRAPIDAPAETGSTPRRGGTPPVPDDPPPPRRRTEGRRAGGRRAGGHPDSD